MRAPFFFCAAPGRGGLRGAEGGGSGPARAGPVESAGARTQLSQRDIQGGTDLWKSAREGTQISRRLRRLVTRLRIGVTTHQQHPDPERRRVRVLLARVLCSFSLDGSDGRLRRPARTAPPCRRASTFMASACPDGRAGHGHCKSRAPLIMLELRLAVEHRSFRPRPSPHRPHHTVSGRVSGKRTRP